MVMRKLVNCSGIASVRKIAAIAAASCASSASFSRSVHPTMP